MKITLRSCRKKKVYMKEPFGKRSSDILISLSMMVFSMPIWLLIAMAVKREDGGPVFYTQERWGRGGIFFKAYKFRTMVPNSDQDFGIKPASENDPRITKIGRILRKMGLDELPQLINIFKGEMSFVGPRSLAVGERAKDERGELVGYEDIPGFWERLKVRPGLTGMATIYIPKDTPPRRKFRYDLLYIKKQSFSLDLRLIALSFWISFRGKWETRDRKF